MIEIGQVLWLKIRFNNAGTVSSVDHPYLVMGIEDDEVTVIEIGQMDSLKPYKLAYLSNKPIYNSDPVETVLEKDSYIQLDNKLQVEYFPELDTYRRTEDKLSRDKLEKILQEYEKYHSTHMIDPNKIVYMTKEEIQNMNP